jgi:hypothetical protein
VFVKRKKQMKKRVEEKSEERLSWERSRGETRKARGKPTTLKLVEQLLGYM